MQCIRVAALVAVVVACGGKTGGQPGGAGGTGGGGAGGSGGAPLLDARAVLDPDRQVLGLRAQGQSEHVCDPAASGWLTEDAGTTTAHLTPHDWLSVDGYEALVYDGDALVLRLEVPRGVTSFPVAGSPTRVLLRAFRGGQVSSTMELLPRTFGLAPGPGPRSLAPAPPQMVAQGGPTTLDVTLDASLASQGRYTVTTHYAFTAPAAADTVDLLSDLPVLDVRDASGSVPYTFAAPTLTVNRPVSADEAVDLTIVVGHEGPLLEVRLGGDLGARMGPDWAFAALGLQWYAAPAGERSLVLTRSVEILAPPGYAVVAPGTRVSQMADGPDERTRYEFPFPVSALSFVLGNLSESASPDGLATSVHFPTCDPSHDADYVTMIQTIRTRYEALFGPWPTGPLSIVGIDGDPTNDPCTPEPTDGSVPPDEQVVSLSRPGMTFGPSALWDGARTPNSDFFFAHEASHQYWGNTVYTAPLDLWLTEGMADHSSGLFLRADQGPSVEQQELELQVPYLRDAIAGGRDAPVVPADPSQLVAEVYYVKGSWVLRELEAWMGPEAWSTLLIGWHHDHVFTYGDTADFSSRVRAVLGPDADAFLDVWLHGTGLPDVSCAAFFEPDGSSGSVLVHQNASSPVGARSVPFVLPLHASATVAGATLGGFALLKDAEGTVNLGR